MSGAAGDVPKNDVVSLRGQIHPGQGSLARQLCLVLHFPSADNVVRGSFEHRTFLGITEQHIQMVEGELGEKHVLDAELQQAECTLAGEVQQMERLAEENNKKVEELRRLKEDMKKLQERNEYHVLMLQDEHASAQQELAHRLTVLREQATQLDLKQGRYKEAARLNAAAAEEVTSLLLKMEQRTKTHGEEVHAIRQEVLHLRQELESTFRKTLKDLGGTYRRKAFKALKPEDKAGMRANKLLRDEMVLQGVGVTALGERYVENGKKAGEINIELKKLREAKEKHRNSLADLQREARAAASRSADIQETKSRIANAEQSLKRELMKKGVPPSCSLEELRLLATKEREEARRLEGLKLRWQQRSEDVLHAIFPSLAEGEVRPPLSPSSSTAPSTSVSGTENMSSFCTSLGGHHSTTMTSPSTLSEDPCCRRRKLRGSSSAPPGLEGFLTRKDVPTVGRSTSDVLAKTQGAEAGWKARVRLVTERWDRRPDDNLPIAEHVRSEDMRSVSPASQTLLEQGGDDKPNSQSDKRDKPRASGGASGATANLPSAPLKGSASTSHLQPWCVPDESPWERKRRMERVIRRRDAGIRAKGLAVNSRGTRTSERHRADGAGKGR